MKTSTKSLLFIILALATLSVFALSPTDGFDTGTSKISSAVNLELDAVRIAQIFCGMIAVIKGGDKIKTGDWKGGLYLILLVLIAIGVGELVFKRISAKASIKDLSINQQNYSIIYLS